MTKEIVLTNSNKKAMVDDEDFEWVNQWKWFLDRDGYAARWEQDPSIGLVKIFMHNEIMKRAIEQQRQNDKRN